MTLPAPEFLELDDVLELHLLSLQEYGGLHGVRDLGLLESALGQPQVSFDGVFAHASVFEMAAAYLFHIARNHPFFDGNKRTALLAALVFLELNDVTLENGSEELYELTMGVAEGRIDKAGAAAALRRLADAD